MAQFFTQSSTQSSIQILNEGADGQKRFEDRLDVGSYHSRVLTECVSQRGNKLGRLLGSSGNDQTASPGVVTNNGSSAPGAEINTPRRLRRESVPSALRSRAPVTAATVGSGAIAPVSPWHVERYTEVQRGRLAVPPGLTGLAQVSGRNALSWDDRIDFDLQYVQENSALVDRGIIVRTVSVVLSGEGVDGHAADDPVSLVVADHPPVPSESADA